ncbi:MAG TPA: hypothetical protein O0W79_05400 [Methanocorpusculum sp.]|nr:hypothetical protein [Methanocorpusculum sp.]HJJ95986.1 hypothetical protein [Methanocorpusculum sp.]
MFKFGYPNWIIKDNPSFQSTCKAGDQDKRVPQVDSLEEAGGER